MAQEFKYDYVRIGPEIEISAELGISLAVLILSSTLCCMCQQAKSKSSKDVYKKVNIRLQ